MILQYIIFNILNVILQTVKSIATVKCGKVAAASINAIAYGLYTYIIVLTNADLPLMFKILVVAIANLIGVFVVKYLEEKSQKEKLWKVEATIPSKFVSIFEKGLCEIPYSKMELNRNYTVFFIYCATKKESAKVKCLMDGCEAKYFVTESKAL